MLKNTILIMSALVSSSMFGETKKDLYEGMVVDISNNYKSLPGLCKHDLLKKIKKAEFTNEKSNNYLLDYVERLSVDIDSLGRFIEKPFQDEQVRKSALDTKDDLNLIRSKLVSTKEFKRQAKMRSSSKVAGVVVVGALATTAVIAGAILCGGIILVGGFIFVGVAF